MLPFFLLPSYQCSLRHHWSLRPVRADMQHAIDHAIIIVVLIDESLSIVVAGAIVAGLLIVAVHTYDSCRSVVGWYDNCATVDYHCCRYEYTYGILTGSVLLVALVRSFLFFSASLRGGTKMHNAMAFRVLHAPLSFFHTNPTGRMLNRFSKDQVLPRDLIIEQSIRCMQGIVHSMTKVAQLPTQNEHSTA